ncbi:APC family permease [Streptomyces luteolifulvus]|uniref:APC family permease n=1 Tax=Streptomyces luteolifulvus TaxID=2615112 RepID=A0A6H9URP1_9ACTN|nr:APC family permease [Streptomyces luteolifulvus]
MSTTSNCTARRARGRQVGRPHQPTAQADLAGARGSHRTSSARILPIAAQSPCGGKVENQIWDTDTTADPGSDPNPSGVTSLRFGVLTARQVIFFVIAAAAPLGFSVGAIPLAIGRGGIGTAGMLLVCGAIFAVFSVGYVAMARHIRKVGGLYLFVTEGLGRPLGVGSAFLAVLSYAVASIGSVGAFAVFAQHAVQNLLHWNTPWELWAFVAVASMALLGLLGVDLNARVLGIVVTCEIAILLVFALVVTMSGGEDGLSATAFSPHEVFGRQPGPMMAIAITAFAGFEATVLYAEEVRDGHRTIRRATYGAISVMMFLYAFVCWAVVQAFGDAGAVAQANTDPTNMFFTATHSFIGNWAAQTLNVVVVTSWFAAILAFHNAASRYLFAMGRDRVLPPMFGRVQQRTGSPWAASAGLSICTLLVVSIFAIGHLDPYLDLFVLCTTPGVIGLPVLTCLASVAVFAYFLRNKRGLPAWQVWFCPLLAAAALAFVTWLIIDQLDLFTGRSGIVNIILPLIVPAAVLFGCARAFWLRQRQPDAYERLAS